MDDAEAVAVVVEVRLACPLSLAFWYWLHVNSSILQWESRDW